MPFLLFLIPQPAHHILLCCYWTDLICSTRQIDRTTFLWQISGPRISSKIFLKDGIDRYRKFILLRTQQQTERLEGSRNNKSRTTSIIVPTYQIDLMWHTHMLSGLALYNRDCQSLLGGLILDHDDSLNDRTEGGTLDVAFQETILLWKSLYCQDYFVLGGMYRGEPPPGYYSLEWDNNHSITNAARVYEISQAKDGPFLHLIGIHGATSTNPTNNTNVVWIWRETKDRMPTHTSKEIVWNPNDCWIRYDPLININLEQAYQKNCGLGVCNSSKGHFIDFVSMKKKSKNSKAYQRDVFRHEDVSNLSVEVVYKVTDKGSNNTSIPWASVKPWTLLNGYAPDGSPAFIESNKKQRKASLKIKTGYIYGKKGQSVWLLSHYHQGSVRGAGETRADCKEPNRTRTRLYPKHVLWI